MPVDRFFHPRAGHSKKVCGLSDLEFRVWWTYELAADDYGVMRACAVTLQASNDALARRPSKTVQRCLQTLVDVGLLVQFEHQDCQYVCQLDWQDFQKVRYPRESHEPVPPPEILSQCSEDTADLFRRRNGNVSETNLRLPRAGGRDTANGIRQEAGGKRQEATALRERFDAFWAAYPRKVAKDAAWRAWQKRRPDETLSAAMLAALARQKTWPQWAKDGGDFIPYPSTWLNQGRWQDEGLESQGREELGSPAWTCPNDPPCPAGTTQHDCHRRAVLEAARKNRKAS